MKSALIGPVVLLGLALASYALSPSSRFVSVIFLVAAIIALLLAPVSVRFGKEWERRFKALDKHKP